MECAGPKWLGTLLEYFLHSPKFEGWLNVSKRSTQINNLILIFSYFYQTKVGQAHAIQLGNNTRLFCLAEIFGHSPSFTKV